MVQLLVLLLFLFFCFGRFVYAKKVERIFDIDPNRKTPAHTKYDAIDFVPAKHWTILFGHHFSSIAGAAPVIGPILAICWWGWGPAVIWVLLGSVFLGGVHDFCSLIISVKHGGCSIADIASKHLTKNAKTIFLIFLWFTLILIVAVFASVCAKTLVVSPNIVVPSIGLIPLALVVGFLMNYKGWSQLWVSIIGVAALVLLMIIGHYFPLAINVQDPILLWKIILFIYALIASICPVQILLQPRDYLSSFLMFFGIFFGYAGIMFFSNSINLPFFIGYTAKPDNLNLFPFLFVTIACGAISGFHSIVSTGTSSKQLANEKDAINIGYGAMIAEAILAVMTIIIVIVGFDKMETLQVMISNKGQGPISAFGYSYGAITKRFLGSYGYIFAITLLNAFILTTLDTATRLCRYITQDLFSIKDRYFATIIVVVFAGWLSISGKWEQLWPLFGAANQLIGALSLIVISSWLLVRKKPVLFTLIPMFFILIVAMGALLYQLSGFLKTGEYVLFIIDIILFLLSGFVFIDAAKSTVAVVRSRK
ncbi:MAG: carbon starvation protein A [Candidatus Omnitrophica bacterium]|nr:carbon starvation protein A [Candidatus Omnitrophota bacterium]